MLISQPFLVNLLPDWINDRGEDGRFGGDYIDYVVAHLFYGKKDLYDLTIYQERAVDFAPYVANIGVNFSLDTQPFELSFFDSGDMKDTSIKIGNSNGDSVTLFYYKDFRIFQGMLLQNVCWDTK